MTVFERRGDRVIVLLSSGNLAGTQAVISVLNQRCDVSDAAAESVERRGRCSMSRSSSPMRCATSSGATREYLEENEIALQCLVHRRRADQRRAAAAVPHLRRGQLHRSRARHAVSPNGRNQVRQADHRSRDHALHTLADATKCVLVSFDSTMRSNLSVGMPIDLICYERDSLEVRMRRRFDEGDAYFTALSHEWSEGVRQVFRQLPELRW